MTPTNYTYDKNNNFLAKNIFTQIVCTELFHTTICKCKEIYNNTTPSKINILAKVLKHNIISHFPTTSTRMILDTGATKHMSG